MAYRSERDRSCNPNPPQNWFFKCSFERSIRPVVLQKYDFESRDSSVLTTFSSFSTIIILSQGSKTAHFSSKDKTRKVSFRWRT